MDNSIDWGERSRGLKYYRGWPRRHDIIEHTRPRRRAERQYEHRVLKGLDLENLAWPLAKKPHQYYW